MKNLLISLFISIIVAYTSLALDYTNSKVGYINQARDTAKLYAPISAVIGENAIFKVYYKPNTKVKLVVDYDNTYKKDVFFQQTNDAGIASFAVPVANDKELVGNSMAAEAYIIDEESSEVLKKAVLQNELGTDSSYNRVSIIGNKSGSGVMFSPIQALNAIRMNYDFDEKSGFNPVTDMIYPSDSPAYIKNMRDAQDNVRTVPKNTNNSN